jgi:hypothetical protein
MAYYRYSITPPKNAKGCSRLATSHYTTQDTYLVIQISSRQLNIFKLLPIILANNSLLKDLSLSNLCIKALPSQNFVIYFIDLNRLTIHWKTFVQKTQIQVCQKKKFKWSILFVSCLGISYKEFIKMSNNCHCL